MEKIMSNFIDTSNDIFIEEIKERIIYKKLENFKILDYNLPINFPVLKPSLNIHIVEELVKNLLPGQIILGKSSGKKKVMLYMDNSGKVWEVTVVDNDIVFDVDYCSYLDKYEIEFDKNVKDESLHQIINYNQSSKEMETYPNVNNKRNSSEYKMMVMAILELIDMNSVDTQSYIDMPTLITLVNTLNEMPVKEWNFIHVSSHKGLSHVFITCDNMKRIWILVTNWDLSAIIDILNIYINLVYF